MGFGMISGGGSWVGLGWVIGESFYIGFWEFFHPGGKGILKVKRVESDNVIINEYISDANSKPLH